jgi:MFS family permease
VKRYAASLRAFAQVFANPRVRNVQLADVGSTLGTWAYGVALPVYAFHSGGTRAVGLLFFARFVFAALAAPWLGLLADRRSRRQLMLIADVVRAAIFAGVTVAISITGLALIGLASTKLGSYPPAQAALMPTLVDSPRN